jgi:hypothetical protein
VLDALLKEDIGLLLDLVKVGELQLSHGEAVGHAELPLDLIYTQHWLPRGGCLTWNVGLHLGLIVLDLPWGLPQRRVSSSEEGTTIELSNLSSCSYVLEFMKDLAPRPTSL